ncbi:MAG: DNA replication and repair protein RecF [Chlamydiia bacterium]|nr:DNA replication and repair protein RecF [Chlamydiia bacterium]
MGLIKKVALTSFRNYSEKELEFKPGINLIHGENGIGKSNLLEALLISSIGRSTRTKNLKEAIQHEQGRFYIDIFYKKEGLGQKIHISFDGKEKEILHNKTKHKSFSSLLGILPSVIYSPNDVNIITGEPKYRRRFMDIHLAQSDPVYIFHLSRYNKALKHRNALLKTNDTLTIEVWEHQLAQSAEIIQTKRKEFIKDLEKIFAEEFAHFNHKDKVPKVIYKPSPKEEITPSSYKESREKDYILGFTTIGPHRDDLLFSLDEETAKHFSSEGEKRLLVIALKLASYRMMDALIFAMDDYYSFLDLEKQAHLIKRLFSLPQVFLTAPANNCSTYVNALELSAAEPCSAPC